MIEFLHMARAYVEVSHTAEIVGLAANTLFTVSLLHGGERWFIRIVRARRIARIRNQRRA